MRCRKVDSLDEPLRALWRRRPDLTQSEWTQLYQVVFRVLSVQDRARYQGLSGTPDEFIQDYFEDRVFRGGKPGGEVNHTCALVEFFDNYLRDRRKDPYVKRRKKGVVGDDDAEPTGDPLDIQTAINAVEEFIQSERDPRSLGQILDLVGCAIQGRLGGSRAPPDTDGLFDLITDFLGIGVPEILASAPDFLGGGGRWVKLAPDAWWIQLYLREHHCPDGGLALNGLARRHQVPSYHYKAVKLGITGPKGAEAALREFRASYLGQWLVSLGIPVDDEHQAEMAIALKILCVAALINQDPGAITARHD